MKINLLVFIAMVCYSPSTVFAYIDPGSGMLIWQGLIAAIGAVFLFVRKPWNSVKKLIARLRQK